jgi:hypothetical protein
MRSTTPQSKFESSGKPLTIPPNPVFRVENPNSHQGLWYDKDGNFNPFITKMTDAKSKDLPMDPDLETYKAGGTAWISGCDSLPDMHNWFSVQDLIELEGAGYNLYRFLVSGYRQVPGHVIFTRESVIDVVKMDLSILKEK